MADILGRAAFVAGLLTLALAGCAAKSRKAAEASRPGGLQGLESAKRLGSAMFRYDALAWLASDALLASGFDGSRLRGWLVRHGDEPEGETVMLGALEGGVLGVIASVRCDVSKGASSCVVAADFAPRPLSAEEAAMRRAFETASADPFFVGSQPSYNHIVLPGALLGVDAGWIVYIVASTTTPGVVPLGRHFRFDVSADGERVLARRASHRGDHLHRPRDAETGQEVVGGMSNSLFDASPAEFLIYTSMLWGLPLGLAACDGSVWWVEGLDVRMLRGSRSTKPCIDPWRE